MRGFSMKNCCILIVCLLISGILLSGCDIKTKSPINYHRRLEKYLPNEDVQKKPQGGTIDLSEGPKLKYEQKMGPKDVNFDIKVVTPY